jgi:hypothetical protein
MTALQGLSEAENVALLSLCHTQITAIRLQLFAAGARWRPVWMDAVSTVDRYFNVLDLFF